ncbi:cell wall-binding repeat-containing protein [Clostridium sporogenes]|nr:cell wall-binding repeat-containing protein [Clostridium sporogenes]NFS25151.1 cell wall-binding repeat-containing protein [Clostridium sporogenes]
MKKTSKALASTAALCLVLSTSSVFAAENTAVAPERLAGANRVDTAIKIAEKSFNNNWKNSGKAILSAAADTNLVDSLAVAPLSYQLEAPILLNDAKDSINAETLKSLKDNKVKTVYIATGEGVISNKAKTQLEKAGFNVERLGGKNRYETAKNILDAFKKEGGKATNVALVSGNGLADALSVAPEAAKSGMPILLTDGKDAVAANLAEVAKAADKVYAIGGNGVISDALVQQLKADRVSGHSRYETNAEVIKKFAGDKEFSKVYIGNGQNSHLVDSLTGSVLAAQSGSPIVLADGSLADATKDALRGKVSDQTGVVALGGEAVVSDKLVKEVTDIATESSPEYVAALKAVKAYEDAKIETVEQIVAAKALKVPADKAVELVKDQAQKDALKARIAAKEKAISEAEAKMQLNVESVSAINAKEIKVVFNREVNKDSAEDAAKYTVYAGSKDNKLETSKYTAKLQDDKKTVIIKLNDALINGQSYKVDVKDIIDTNYKKMVEYKGTYSLFQDTEAPKVLKAEYAGSTVKLTFDEPLKAKPTIKIDNSSVADGDIKLSEEAGKYEVTISNLSNDASSVGKHEVKIYGVEDLAGNKADMLTTTYTATENTAKPSIEKVEAYSQNTFKIKFNTSLNELKSSNFEIKKGNYTFASNDITVTNVNDEEYTYKVTVKSSDDKNPLYAEKENSVSLDVKVKDFKGTNDVFGDAYSTTVKLSKDTTAPVVQSDSLNRVENNKLVVIFNEDLKSADKDKISITQDGVIKTVNNAAVDGTDAKKLVIDLGTLAKGTYNIELDKGAVKDLADNANEVIKTKVVYEAEADTPFKPTSVAIDASNTKNNVIKVTYGKKMTDSALNLANYKIDKVALNDASYKGTTIGFEDDTKQVVKITLAKGNIKENGSQLVEISKAVLADNGQYVAADNDGKTVYTETVANFKDDIAPTVKNIELVKGTSNATSTNTIKVTFSEDIKVENGKDATNDFIVKAGDTKLPVKAVTIKGTDNKDRDYAVLTLGQNINVSGQTVTIKVTDDKDDNNDGINIIDMSTLTNKVGVTDTVKIEKVVTDASVVEESKKIDEADVATAKTNLKMDGLDNVTANLTLPTTQDGCDVSWESANTAVLANNGTVTRPEVGQSDVNVKLTATITKGAASDTKEFDVVVKAQQ